MQRNKVGILSKSEDFFLVDSSKLDEDIAYIKRNTIKNIELNPFTKRGYRIDNIIQISTLPFIEKLHITANNIDVSGIENFKKLQYFYFHDDTNHFIDFKNFPDLKELNIRLHENIINLKDCQNLENLYAWKLDSRVVKSDFFNYFKLKKLTLSQAKNLIDLGYYKLPPSLEELNLFYCLKLENIDSITYLDGVLKCLEIDSCKKIGSLEILGKLRSLERLIIDNSTLISSAKLFSSLKVLNHLAVMGSSYFLDGDLSPLLRIAQMGHVGIDNKRHYSHTFEQLNPTFKWDLS